MRAVFGNFCQRSARRAIHRRVVIMSHAAELAAVLAARGFPPEPASSQVSEPFAAPAAGDVRPRATRATRGCLTSRP